MTESEWFASTKPTEMGLAVLRRKRASERVMRLVIASFWRWQSHRLKSTADRNGLQTAVALLEQWVETGVEPDDPARTGYIFFSYGPREAFRHTLGVAAGWSGKYGKDATERLLWLLRETFGNPFSARKRKNDPHRWSSFDPAWRTDTVVTLAKQIYESREFSTMPILADALQDAGCTNEDLLAHCRVPVAGEPVPGSPAPPPHVRGCWALDLVLGKS